MKSGLMTSWMFHAYCDGIISLAEADCLWADPEVHAAFENGNPERIIRTRLTEWRG